jgi:hypothetical protein
LLYKVIFPLEMALINGETEGTVVVSAGEYLMERIPNPLFPGKGDWLVFRGSKIGMAKQSFYELEKEKIRPIRIRVRRIA